jgi:O-acetyl-ADP-ribose deacetylase (regulator of RNase III)
MSLVSKHGCSSVAFPVIGAGSGGYDQASALDLMLAAFQDISSSARVIVVRYGRRTGL